MAFKLDILFPSANLLLILKNNHYRNKAFFKIFTGGGEIDIETMLC